MRPTVDAACRVLVSACANTSVTTARVNTREHARTRSAPPVSMAALLLLRMTEELAPRFDANRWTIMTLNDLPPLLTVDETASLLRTTRKAVYAMAERAQLPGVTRIGRRLLVRSVELVHWLDQNSALSLKE